MDVAYYNGLLGMGGISFAIGYCRGLRGKIRNSILFRRRLWPQESH